MMETKIEKVKIKYLADIDKLEKINKGDWIDLRCAEDTELKAGEYKLVPLGIAMELPSGYEALVAPRSSTFKHYGVILANSLGIIDETYKGDNDEWRFLAYATKDTVIPKNERICQFRIIEHQPHLVFEEVDSLGNDDRGGIGSTGTTDFKEPSSIIGKKYRVIKDSEGHFNPGDIVVPIEDSDVPYCVLAEKYKSGNSMGYYNSGDYWALAFDELEEV